MEALTMGDAASPDDDWKSNSKADPKSPESEKEQRERVLRKTMLLAVAYSANIGGTGSLIGTAPNLVLKGLFDE